MRANGASIIIRRRLLSPLGAVSLNTSTFACAATIRFSSTPRNFHLPRGKDGMTAQARPPSDTGSNRSEFGQLPSFVPGVAGQ
jgi:hypothetical protein